MTFSKALHPGVIVQQYLGDALNISDLADHLGISRAQMSRIMNGHAGISAGMALKLAEAFETSPNLWVNLQSNYDLSEARRKRSRQPKIAAIRTLRATA